MTITPEAMDSIRENFKRRMSYEKMDNIVKRMQDKNTGISFRPQKSFMTASSNDAVFAGEDVVAWLRKYLDMSGEEGKDEAMRLATLLCTHGYIFPIGDLKNLTVKDDNTLYRFQTPCFWPLTHLESNNDSYAIYLMKRSMRNKKSHGLEDYEQTAFSRLQNVLRDKWDSIRKHAQEQVIHAKSMKRADKRLRDAHERAFWRVRRPPPGQVNCLDVGLNRNFQASQIQDRKTKNKDLLLKEVAYLRKAQDRCRMKVSKAIESYFHRVELYEDNDSFLASPIPSNPWISSDKTFWETCYDNVDLPPERRVKKWGISLHELISDAIGRQEFERYLKTEYSQENIRFWRACEELKFCPLSEVEKKIDGIFAEFLASGAPHEINIDGKTMEMVRENLKKNKQNRFTFEPAQEHIYALMKKDSYPRFLRSNHYKSLLENSLQGSGKKRLFGWSSRKKTLTPSPQPKRRSSTGDDKNGDAPGVAHHSYSTGNLRELDEKASPVLMRRENKSIDSPASVADVEASPPLKPASRKSMADSNQRKSKLDVPHSKQTRSMHVPTGESSGGKGETTSCLAISVPSKTNVVTPWEGDSSNAVAPWEAEWKKQSAASRGSRSSRSLDRFPLPGLSERPSK